jgi:hypothetical protein
MMTALSGNATSVQALVASMPPTPPPSTAAASTVNRATAPDTVTISAAGQQASQASQDVDRDGDSH